MKRDVDHMDDQLPLPALFEAARGLIFEEFHRRLADEGYGDIRNTHGCVFRFVEPEGSRLTYLAERAGYTKQAVGEVVDDLERMGYVERVPDPDDRRAKIIHPTKRGQASMRAARTIFAEIEARWALELGARNMANLRRTLERAVAVAGLREAA
jgi:DNA-binding MarR family transcriptional regulator